MLVFSGGHLSFMPFSAALAALHAISKLLYLYLGSKALKIANLSLYSIFAMMGGMLLPFCPE